MPKFSRKPADWLPAIDRARAPASPANPCSVAAAAAAPAATDPLAGVSKQEREALRADGHALYEANACFRCHESERADGGTVPVLLTELGAKYDLASLAAFLAAPQPPMPRFALDDAQRRALAVYLLESSAR